MLLCASYVALDKLKSQDYKIICSFDASCKAIIWHYIWFYDQINCLPKTCTEINLENLSQADRVDQIGHWTVTDEKLHMAVYKKIMEKIENDTSEKFKCNLLLLDDHIILKQNVLL